MRGWCMRWWGGGSRRTLRWLAALLCWGALAALALPRLQPLPPHRPAPPARLLLQSEPQPAVSTPAPTPAPQLPDTDHRIISENEIRADLERRLPSLPYAYWHKHKDDKNKFFKKKDCAPFPSIYELQFHNTYWQSLYSSQGVFHFYGAYMDARNASRIGRAVRVLGVHDRIKPTIVTHCQLWFEERAEPVLVRNLEYKYIWNSKWGNYRDHVLQPYLMACVLPKDVQHLVPASVSIVENACDRATNNLRVHNDRPNPVLGRKEFAVCVKGLDFLHEDLSVRLVEWIELIKIMGADKVFFYELQVHQNITKVLDYYKKQGTVTVTPITLPGGQPNLPGLQHMYLKSKTTHKRQMELIPYNDCLYRHMYEYRWLALLDIDEVIVPLEDADWSSLMKRILPLSKQPSSKPPRSSYHASNIYYLDSLRHEHGWEEGLPRYMHMLQHVYRTRNFTKPGQYVKAFHETDRVLALHNHFPLACLGGPCSSYALETKHARLQHYRADCVSALSKTCKELRSEPVRDTTLWRWRDPLVSRTEAVLRTLGFLPPHR
ncbi:beta-1,4-galactosyltransferase galt-1-like [Plodia interpunctella]|uniref:beta-1,4-galactosyltransferase galt-1-like n=1 Tax=Plodia interpunctella TaxID=58824 RepID=UPI002367B32E|nr:beta-1,4-galactosyltransferase galt-1-like [Plodia interpunctella]XP_053617279.1 beta-1,4-galactosyltransferase galt-1-like [Plodia interpunctella]